MTTMLLLLMMMMMMTMMMTAEYGDKTSEDFNFDMGQ